MGREAINSSVCPITAIMLLRRPKVRTAGAGLHREYTRLTHQQKVRVAIRLLACRDDRADNCEDILRNQQKRCNVHFLDECSNVQFLQF